mmetsp:Transcript_3315/g.6519  ORF Transcript_3315/g.6519 Transcript_3315/m.6519 type:complete len:246 (+) Transcript_3315:196-933(+)
MSKEQCLLPLLGLQSRACPCHLHQLQLLWSRAGKTLQALQFRLPPSCTRFEHLRYNIHQVMRDVTYTFVEFVACVLSLLKLCSELSAKTVIVSFPLHGLRFHFRQEVVVCVLEVHHCILKGSTQLGHRCTVCCFQSIKLALHLRGLGDQVAIQLPKSGTRFHLLPLQLRFQGTNLLPQLTNLSLPCFLLQLQGGAEILDLHPQLFQYREGVLERVEDMLFGGRRIDRFRCHGKCYEGAELEADAT